MSTGEGASRDAQDAPGGRDIQELGAGGQRIFVRNATGLVRSATPLDVMVFNICGNLVIPFATGLFWAYTIWPRTNFLVAIAVGGVLCSFTWVCWALLAATFPRTGGGYIYNTRILHPIVGFAADWTGQFVGSVLAMALWTTWFATVGLAGVFSIWGVLRNDTRVAGWGVTVSSQNWTFALGLGLIFCVFGVAAWSLKKSLFMQNLTFFVATAGLILAVIIMLFTSHGDYVNHFNSFAQRYTHQKDSYHWIVQQAQKNGFTRGGFSFSDTFGSIFVVLTVSIWAWSSAYLAGEMRGARSARRQLRVMAGAGTIQILLILVATWAFFRAAGSDFFASINYLNTIGQNPLPAPPYYTLLAGVMVSNPILAAVIVFSFVFNIWAGLWELIGATSRPLFAYSFDGVLPQRLAKVSDRTHTPIVAIGLLFLACIGVHWWATYDNSGFFKIWALVGLTAFVMMTVTAISAILLPIRRRDDYRRSPARYEVLGIPVIQIFGLLSLVTCGVFFAIVFKYPSVLGTATLKSAWLTVVIIAASAVAIFLAMKWWRWTREGVRLEAAYAEIPPE